MTPEELAAKELEMLREELRGLKACQITLLTTSITGTGLLFGLTQVQAGLEPVAFLFPLVILLPSWIAFFDKATTITRIVGYLRLAESLVLTPSSVKNFTGWERSLRRFRELEDSGTLPGYTTHRLGSRIIRFIGALLFFGTQRYWAIAFWVFLGLTGVSLLITWTLIPQASVATARSQWLMAVAATVLSGGIAVAALALLWGLTVGRYRYDAMQHAWDGILN